MDLNLLPDSELSLPPATGRSDLDCLREFDLLNALKLSSKEHTSVTAYQVHLFLVHLLFV